jgi:hypothetical protein
MSDPSGSSFGEASVPAHGSIEAISKAAALISALLIVALQIAVHPDATPALRAAAALALIAGWLAARVSRQSIHAVWLFLAPLAPAALRAITGREGPILDLIWMAGLTGTLLRSVAWTRWTFPPAWRVLLGGWALSLSLGWPVIVAREINFDPHLLRDAGVVNSWALLTAPQVVSWTMYVALTQLLGLLWFDWVYGRLAAAPDRTPRPVHALWAGATLASLVALYQGAVNLAFLSTPAWASLRRATGTMLDANAYGVTAAIAGLVAVLALRRRSSRYALSAAVVVLFVNLAGMWMSGSRTALICAIGGVAGLGAGLWRSPWRSPRRLVPTAALATLVVIAALVAMGPAVGPLGRLLEAPGGGTGNVLASLWNRGGYGTIAVRMLRQYPLTGVGVGAYHVIAPDYWRVMTDRQLPFDNAQNWWRHVAAEFGMLGGASILLWSLLVVWLVCVGRPRPGQRVTATALRGLIAGLGACSLLGMPTQTPVVLLSFFLLVAWLSVLLQQPDLQPLAKRTQAGWVAVALLAILYGSGHLLLAQGRLSLESRAVAAHHELDIGSYPLEGQPGSGQFRWTAGHAHFIWPARTRWLMLRVWVEHPDMAVKPVHVTIDAPCGLLLDRTLTTSDPVTVGVELPEGQPIAQVDVRVSRTWRPTTYGVPDSRDLGAALVTDFVSGPSVLAQQSGPPVLWPACQAEHGS